MLAVGIGLWCKGYSDSNSFADRIKDLKFSETIKKRELEAKQTASDQQTVAGVIMTLIGGTLLCIPFVFIASDWPLPDSTYIYRAGSILQRQRMNNTLNDIRDHFSDM